MPAKCDVKNPPKSAVIAKSQASLDAALDRAQKQADKTGVPVEVYYNRATLDVSAKGGKGRGYEVYHSTAYPDRGNKGRRRNPGGDDYEEAARASEEFHGIEPHELIEVKTEIFEHDHLGDIGELVKLEIIGVHGGIIDLKNFGGARLARSPKGYNDQLYIAGGDQEVDLDAFEIDSPHECEYLGELKFITYYTVKHHLGRDGGDANYRHRFNDADKRRVGTKKANRPRVIYDVNNKLLSLAGGEYEILAEGIDN